MDTIRSYAVLEFHTSIFNIAFHQSGISQDFLKLNRVNQMKVIPIRGYWKVVNTSGNMVSLVTDALQGNAVIYFIKNIQPAELGSET
jgi:hypothetical protein